MFQIKTYIINLERSVERKIYMEKQLMQYPFLSCEFVSAIDGRSLSEEERLSKFDEFKFYNSYKRNALLGEIGCTLSHQKCYQFIAKHNDSYALILEDDTLLDNELERIFQKINVFFEYDSSPRIILLSGWYYYTRKYRVVDNYYLADVYDGYGTYAYVINKRAAELLIEKRPFSTADDWNYIKSRGIKLQAIYPHLLITDGDRNNELSSTILSGYKSSSKKTSWIPIKTLVHSLVLKILKFVGLFETR